MSILSPVLTTANTSDLPIKVFEDSYSEGVIALIDRVYQKYGDRICLPNADSDLNDISRTYFSTGGCFWLIADESDTVIGTVAIIPEQCGQALLKRLYLEPASWGTGAGGRLLDHAVDWCITKEIHTLHFWSDVRFTRAHAFYEKRGYIRDGIRHMNDGWIPYSEYHFTKKF